jgi:hypothetical protein
MAYCIDAFDPLMSLDKEGAFLVIILLQSTVLKMHLHHSCKPNKENAKMNQNQLRIRLMIIDIRNNYQSDGYHSNELILSFLMYLGRILKVFKEGVFCFIICFIS